MGSSAAFAMQIIAPTAKSYPALSNFAYHLRSDGDSDIIHVTGFNDNLMRHVISQNVLPMVL
jgi:hypothetical protein